MTNSKAGRWYPTVTQVRALRWAAQPHRPSLFAYAPEIPRPTIQALIRNQALTPEGRLAPIGADLLVRLRAY